MPLVNFYQEYTENHDVQNESRRCKEPNSMGRSSCTSLVLPSRRTDSVPLQNAQLTDEVLQIQFLNHSNFTDNRIKHIPYNLF